MRRALWGLAGLIVVTVGVFVGVLVFDAPLKPPPLASISKPFTNVDFSDLPAVQTYTARDGAKLGYRVYEAGGPQVVVLIHGSTGESSGMHPLAKALRDTGASIYVPDLRGHGNSGRRGDIDYIGQLEDDLADFVAVIQPLHPNTSRTLIGFSAGGGFVLRVIGGPDEKLFDRFIMVSPALPPGAPTYRPLGDWASLAMPRIILLAMLNRIGVDWFNGLSVVAFATSPKVPNLTSFYSYRLGVNFGAPLDYLAALGRSTKPVALLVGGGDEVFYPDRFAPLLRPARSDLQITIVPGVGHIGMTVAPAGIAALRKSVLDLTAATTG
jgi:non-heme chloroperoxidase